MRQHKYILAYVLTSVSVHAIADTWNQRSDFGGTARSGAVAFTIGDRAFLGTGEDGDYVSDLWEYEPVSDVWIQRAAFPGVGRYEAVSFVIGSKGYIGAGINMNLQTHLSDFWEYDPEQDTWQQIPDFPGTARAGACAFTAGGAGYVTLGTDGLWSYPIDMWAYDPGLGVWSEKASFPGPGRNAGVGFAIDQAGFVGTGKNSVQWLKDIWRYDTGSDTWQQVSDMGGLGVEGRQDAVAFTMAGKGYIATGAASMTPLFNEVWEYDPSGDDWTPKEPLPGAARFRATAFVVGDAAYIATGTNGFRLDDVWSFVPNVNSGMLEIAPAQLQIATDLSTGSVFVEIPHRGILDVHTSEGRLVASMPVPPGKWPIGSFPAGVYCIGLLQGTDRFYGKLAITR